MDNKPRINFGEDKTKSILFSSQHKIKKASPLNIQYKDIKIKQYTKVTYLGCILDKTLSPPGNKTSWRRRNVVSLYVPTTLQVRPK